jgi:hypothetical protein
MFHKKKYINYILNLQKAKEITLQAWTGPEGSKR